KSVLIEMEDMTMEVERLFETVEDDPQELEMVNINLQNLYRLEKKHQVTSVKDLLMIQTQLEEKVAAVDQADKTTARLEKAIAETKEKTEKQAVALYENRKKILPKFVKSVENLLKELGMPNARLKINLEKASDFNRHGRDE